MTMTCPTRDRVRRGRTGDVLMTVGESVRGLRPPRDRRTIVFEFMLSLFQTRRRSLFSHSISKSLSPETTPRNTSKKNSVFSREQHKTGDLLAYLISDIAPGDHLQNMSSMEVMVNSSTSSAESINRLDSTSKSSDDNNPFPSLLDRQQPARSAPLARSTTPPALPQKTPPEALLPLRRHFGPLRSHSGGTAPQTSPAVLVGSGGGSASGAVVGGEQEHVRTGGGRRMCTCKGIFHLIIL